MKKKLLLILFVVVTFSISSHNFMATSKSLDYADIDISGVLKIALADGEIIPCSSPGDYFSTGMQHCFTTTPCYRGSEQCGEQKCCESAPTQQSCTEYECD